MSNVVSISGDSLAEELGCWVLDNQEKIKNAILVVELDDDIGSTVIKSCGSVSHQDVAWAIITLQTFLIQELGKQIS